MKALKILLFTLLIIVYIKGDYSIEGLIDYLEQTGIYNILVTVNDNFGNDVTIDLCQRIVQSYSCNYVVKVYIGPPRPRPKPKPGGPPYISPTMREILTDTNNFLILAANMDFNDLMELVNSY